MEMSQILGIVVITLVIVALVSVFIRIYNTLVALKFNVDKAFANIDVLLKQRAEEIPNLIITVKAYMSHEKDLLTNLTALRTQYLETSNQEKKVKLNNELGKVFGKIMAVAENYPELKSNNSFVKLQERISQLEDNISDRREFFNESVNLYNVGINEFPNLILSKFMGYNEKQLLQILEIEKKYNGVKF